ncbi:MAG: response regulator transcription factor [Flavobacteriales bacterium]|nr:response regulator transcription factor [Flavobacteriales bacterium]
MLELHKNILLVEDDPSLGFIIKDNLQEAGYVVTWCKDGEHGFETFYQGKFDLCVLDVMLPKKDGFTLAGDIRQLNVHTPIIFLTAKSLEMDKIIGFKKGGDDYLTKPFAMEELIVRIEAVIKRSYNGFKVGETNGKDIFNFGACEFNFQSLELKTPINVFRLTVKESELLRMLCMHQNEVLPRSLALKLIWGKDDYFLGRSMDVFITRLRKYLKDDPSVMIMNETGVGFSLRTPSE